jgi:Fe-S oxidoreductase
VLFVEFFGENEKQLNLKNRLLEGQVSEIKSCYHNFYTKDSELINNAIKLRKDGLGLIMNQVTSVKPLAFIEDSAIPLEYLSEYVSAIEDYCNQINVNLVLYAHASVGVLHIRPYLDLHKEEEIEKLQNISAYAFSLVKKYGGSWSGEHGDGRVRSPQLKEYYGEKIYNAWVDVKNIFDPKGLLNPGIIIEPNDITQDLKVNPRLHQKKINTTFKYRKEGSFGELINNCTGIGVCVKHNVGTMCPSYMATHDEKDSTRGRANILRLSINGELHNKDITTKEAEDALALCLSCKACKSECPSNVDVAKLKSEYLQLKYIKKGISPLEWSIRKSDLFSRRFSGKFAGIINKIQHSTIARKLIERVIGIDHRRSLPDYSKYTLVDWYEKNYKSVKDGIAVALFCDTYINYHEPHIGKAAINLLNEAGYNVLLANVGCCQRPKISNGFLKDAKELGNETILGLLPYFEKNIPVVVCEPSCTSALIDDLPDLIEDESLAEYAKNNVYQIENFIISQIEAGIINKTLKYKAKDVLIQNHCHAQALWDNHQIDSTIESEKVNCPDVGCCGMAGSFGYEKVRYDVSRRIYENRLGPSLKANENSTIVSNGFSCRHQIKDFGRKSAIHWVEAVEWI